jgi:hypothetical protein
MAQWLLKFLQFIPVSTFSFRASGRRIITRQFYQFRVLFAIDSIQQVPPGPESLVTAKGYNRQCYALENIARIWMAECSRPHHSPSPGKCRNRHSWGFISPYRIQLRRMMNNVTLIRVVAGVLAVVVFVILVFRMKKARR